MSDEIYARMVYDNVPHASMLVYPELADRLILLDGWSKTYAMTGWRLGYAVWPKDLAEHATRLAINIHSCVNAATQWAGIEALKGPQDAVDRMVAAFDERRKVILERLNALPGFRCVRPGGAFYAFPNITGTGYSARAAPGRSPERGRRRAGRRHQLRRSGRGLHPLLLRQLDRQHRGGDRPHRALPRALRPQPWPGWDRRSIRCHPAGRRSGRRWRAPTCGSSRSTSRRMRASLYRLSHARPEDAALWTYLAYGPFADQGAFAAWLEERARSARSPVLRDRRSRRAARPPAWRAISTSCRPTAAIEIGHIWFAPALQKTRAATEAIFLMIAPRLRRPRLPAAGVEVRRAERGLDPRRAPLRLHLRGHLPPAHGGQGPQPRHRLVRAARSRLAGGARRLRALAGARTTSMPTAASAIALSALTTRPLIGPTPPQAQCTVTRSEPIRQ